MLDALRRGKVMGSKSAWSAVSGKGPIPGPTEEARPLPWCGHAEEAERTLECAMGKVVGENAVQYI